MLSKNSKKKRRDIYTDLKRKGFRKPRNGEINYFPEIPEGETYETLKSHKEDLQNEFNKRQPSNVILDQKMSLTYYLRRQEIVKYPKKLNDYEKEWPMLFSPEMLQKEMIRLVGIDPLPKMKKNLKNKALLELAMKQMPMNALSDGKLLKLLPNIFKEKWSFFIEKIVPDSTSLFSEDVLIEECELPPHPIIVETASGWSIMG